MRAVFTLALLVLLIWGAVRVVELIQPQDKPWTPLDLSAPVGLATKWKLDSLKGDPKWCRTLLRLDKVEFEPVADRVTAPGCGWSGAVRLTGASLSPSGPVMTCPVAAALTIWERAVVRPAARAHLGSNLTRLDTYGTYSCRPVAGTSRTSQHATANAIDIAAFRTVRGTPVSVARDWNGTPEKAAFLRQVHDGGCEIFGTTLGPEYNAAHRDHFHLDMAGWSFCR